MWQHAPPLYLHATLAEPVLRPALIAVGLLGESVVLAANPDPMHAATSAAAIVSRMDHN